MSAISLVVNGKRRPALDGETVADFLRALDLTPVAVLVEHNGVPLERELFAQTLLRDGDRVEIAQMVGGG